MSENITTDDLLANAILDNSDTNSIIISVENIDPLLITFIYDRYTDYVAYALLFSFNLINMLGADYLMDNYLNTIYNENNMSNDELSDSILSMVESDMDNILRSYGIVSSDSSTLAMKNIIIDSISSISDSEEYQVFLSTVLESIELDNSMKLASIVSIMSGTTVLEVLEAISDVSPILISTISSRLLSQLDIDSIEFDNKKVKQTLTYLSSFYPEHEILANTLINNGVSPGLEFKYYLPELKNTAASNMKGRLINIISLILISKEGSVYPIETCSKYADMLFTSNEDKTMLKDILLSVLHGIKMTELTKHKI